MWKTQIIEQLARQREAFEPFQQLVEQYTAYRKRCLSRVKIDIDAFHFSESHSSLNDVRLQELEKQCEAVKALLKDREEELSEKERTFTEVASRNVLLTNENSELKLQLDSVTNAYQAKAVACEQILANSIKLKERDAERVNDLQAFYIQFSQQTNIELPPHLKTFVSPRPIGYRGIPAVQKSLRQIHPFNVNCMTIGRLKDKDHVFGHSYVRTFPEPHF